MLRESHMGARQSWRGFSDPGGHYEVKKSDTLAMTTAINEVCIG